MKFRNRLLVAFLVVMLLPLSMTALVAGIFYTYQANAIEEAYGVSGSLPHLTGGATTKIISSIATNHTRIVKEKLEEDAEQFLDITFLQEYNKQFVEKNSYLVVLRGDKVIFSGAEVSAVFLDSLVKEAYVEDMQYNTEFTCFYQNLLIEQNQPEAGRVIVVTRGDATIPEMKYILRDLVAGIILILFLTAVLLVFWIYRSMIVPIMRLRVAMQQVRDGNLDYVLEVEADSEFGPLCADFNQMRMRLRESRDLEQQNDAENRELISNISHDLKTPITSIKGYVEALLDGVAATPERSERYLRTVYNKAVDMDRLIEELTFYTKVDTDRIPYRFDKVNVLAFFKDCADEKGMDLAAQGMEMQFENYVTPNTFVKADAEQMRRVLNNIIGNSMKYMDKEKGLITIALREDARHVYIEISDNGQGISEEALPHIFDRFYRADQSRNQNQPGSGIGLSIVRKIIEDHGGNVYATSELGVGTTITIELIRFEEETYDEENSDY